MKTRRHRLLLHLAEFSPIVLAIAAVVAFCVSGFYAAMIAVSEEHYWEMIGKGATVLIGIIALLGILGYLAERHLDKRGLLPPHYYD